MHSAHRPDFHYRLLAPRYWATWAALLGLCLLSLLPLRLLGLIGDAAGRLFLQFAGQRANIVDRNLQLCYPQLDAAQRAAITARHARILGHVYADIGRLFTRSVVDLNRRFDVSGHAFVQKEIDAGRKIILLTAHTVAMETAGHWLAENYAVVSVVRVHAGNPMMDWAVGGTRGRRALIFSHLGSMLPLIKAVRAGRYLFYLPDDDHGAANNIFVPLFGVAKATPPTLGRLARACAAAVIPTATAYDPQTRRFSVRFLPALTEFPSGDDVRDATRMNGAIEALINLDPAQYLWSAKIFRSRPTGERSPYK